MSIPTDIANLTEVQQQQLKEILERQNKAKEPKKQKGVIIPPSANNSITVSPVVNESKCDIPPEVVQQMPAPTLTVDQYKELLSQFDAQKILEDNKEKIQDAQYKNASNERAEREPLPAMTAEAFNNDPLIITIGDKDIELRKMVAVDITIFKLTDNPFYRIMVGEINQEETGSNAMRQLFPDEELLYEIVYQFTHPAKDVYKLVKKDKAAFHELVIEEVGTEYSPAELIKLVEAILKHIGLVNEARVQFTATDSDEDGKKKQLSD